MTETYDQDFKPQYFKEQVFKRWHRGGFITVSHWPYAEKVHIEIGYINPTTKAITDVAEAYVDLHEFLAYLHAEVNGNLIHVYPDFRDKKFQVFGGGKNKETGVITSRIFTSYFWKDVAASKKLEQNIFDETKRTFACENYEGNQTSQGAYTPDRNKLIAVTFVQMSMKYIAELYQALSISASAYAIQKADKVAIFDD